MKKDSGSEQLDLRVWRQIYQAYALLKRCEDTIYEKHGLTTEQYAVLVTISYIGEPARVSDIARWLERSTNSISMIVDRMVKAGLVRRVRDRRDRRVVYISKTGKADSLFRPATVESFASIESILSVMAQKDKLALVDLLGEVKYQTLKCVNPGVDIQQVKRDELKRAAGIGKWLSQYGRLPNREIRHQGGKREKTEVVRRNMTKCDDLEQLVVDLPELSYETGYIAGKIEAGKSQDEVGKSYQTTRISQRNNCYQLILSIIDDIRTGSI